MDSEERSLDEVHHHAEQEAEYGNAYHGNDEEESAGSEGIEIDDDGRMMEEETHSRLAVFHSSQKSVFVGSRTPPSLEANFLNLQNVGEGHTGGPYPSRLDLNTNFCQWNVHGRFDVIVPMHFQSHHCSSVVLLSLVVVAWCWWQMSSSSLSIDLTFFILFVEVLETSLVASNGVDTVLNLLC
jgi:hypothetical protein